MRTRGGKSKDVPSGFASRLQELRRQKNLSQTELGQRAGRRKRKLQDLVSG